MAGKRLIKAAKHRRLDLKDRCRGNLSMYITNKVYAEAVISLEGDDSDDEKVATLYKQGICKLPTKDLELILQVHDEDSFTRQEDTLECIVSELARRVLMEKK